MKSIIDKIFAAFLDKHQASRWTDGRLAEKMRMELPFILAFASKDEHTFQAFIAWQKGLLQSLNISYDWFEELLEVLLEAVRADLAPLAIANIEQTLHQQRPFQLKEEDLINPAAIAEFHIKLMQDVDSSALPLNKKKMEIDAGYVLYYLNQAEETKNETLFDDFLLWHCHLLEIIKIPELSLIRFLTSIRLFCPPKQQAMLDKSLLKLIQNDCLSPIEKENISTEDIAQQTADWHFELFQGLDKHCTEERKHNCINDAEKHLQFLEQAVTANSSMLFTEYITWVKSTLTALGIESISIIRFLVSLRLVLKYSQQANALPFLEDGILRLIEDEINSPDLNCSFLQTNEAKIYLDFLLKGNRKGASNYILNLVEEGKDIKEIYINIFQSSQYEIGLLWEKNKVSVAEEHFCTATTQMIMSMLYPKIFSLKSLGKSVVATCVGSELHELGIRMVADFLEMEGWDTYYIGANTPSVAILEAIKQNKADLLAISVTLTPHVQKAKDLIQIVRANAPHVKIMVGGYPFIKDKTLWKKMGADGLAESAKTVHQVALSLVS